jgi:hypothetical protein
VRTCLVSLVLNLAYALLQVKIICNLRHREASPLAKVCTQMQEAVNEAMQFHFAYNTPLPQACIDQPGAPRHSKRLKLETVNQDILGAGPEIDGFASLP